MTINVEQFASYHQLELNNSPRCPSVSSRGRVYFREHPTTIRRDLSRLSAEADLHVR